MQLDSDELFAGADERRLAEALRRDMPGNASHSTAHRCPRCLEQSLYRSRHRGAWESLKRKLTGRRVYRCHKCGWRGWLVRQLG
jgi:predicted RNA-binding Zn-ribbon protein involved in translation (DUF1610 family)